ncbi:putative tellurite resistance protein B-like protein [Breoghania corrubedonensis]|uniref:Putative tellurite resistance protein B-like protein n=1 Tax=Breoghania corrubedonensis TaxID=665038 RepID=A0A2T5V5P2_9HYPH|nr:TerB family tellurite resistance protein [Breoghania corrubedonensis]PTW59061.1 putative tellurite resistance protein B-like protein [Breoghania corrubedonensis]
MLKKLKKFLHDVTVGEDEDKAFDADDHRLCAAALMVHIISVDGVVDDSERKKLRQVLQSSYDLDEQSTSELIEEAGKRNKEAVDLYGFTSVLKRRLDIDGRRKVVEMMWEMVFADGEVHEFEDNTVWRVTELLGLPASDRLALRRRVATRENIPLDSDTINGDADA